MKAPPHKVPHELPAAMGRSFSISASLLMLTLLHPNTLSLTASTRASGEGKGLRTWSPRSHHGAWAKRNVQNRDIDDLNHLWWMCAGNKLRPHILSHTVYVAYTHTFVSRARRNQYQDNAEPRGIQNLKVFSTCQAFQWAEGLQHNEVPSTSYQVLAGSIHICKSTHQTHQYSVGISVNTQQSFVNGIIKCLIGNMLCLWAVFRIQFSLQL